MYGCMRTTLVLDDQLFRSAKRQAGKEGTTLSDLVNCALRKHLLARPLRQADAGAFSMPTFGEPTGVHLTPGQIADWRDDGR